MIGQRNGCGAVLLTLTERVTRYEMIFKIEGKTSSAVTEALNKLKHEYSENFSQIFKSITSDTGTEFSELSKLETTGCKIYFTHRYSSSERGTNENHNGIIRRFIPKGKLIEEILNDFLEHIKEWMNTLPRKILNYRTPEELFENYLDQIYQINA